MVIKLCGNVDGGRQMTSIYFGICMSKVKVTVTLNPKFFSGQLLNEFTYRHQTLWICWWLPTDYPYSFWCLQVKGEGHSDLESENLVRKITRECILAIAFTYGHQTLWICWWWLANDPYSFWVCRSKVNSYLKPENLLRKKTPRTYSAMVITLCGYIDGGQQMTPMYFGGLQVKGQGHSDPKPENLIWSTHSPMVIKLCGYVDGGWQMTPIYFGVCMSKVKVTVTLNPKTLSKQ